VTPKQQQQQKTSAVDTPVAVCVVEDQQIAGVVTVTHGSTSAELLLEGTFEGLTPGKKYTIEVEGHAAQVSGDNQRVSVSTKIISASPISAFVGKRLSLSDGASTKIVREMKPSL
jgi:hypothetical protein